MQKIIDLQNSSDVFPALPEALAALNGSSVESLAGGGALPERGQIFPALGRSSWRFLGVPLLQRRPPLLRALQVQDLEYRYHPVETEMTLNRYKYEKHLEQTLGKDNNDLVSLN